MARRIVHQLVDDLDGTVLEPGAGETVRFSLDGTAYEIDLADENAAAFRDEHRHGEQRRDALAEHGAVVVVRDVA